MINVYKDNKLSGTIQKPESFTLLFQEICRMYKAEPERVFIAWLEENNDKTFLEKEDDYQKVIETQDPLEIVAYIKPKEWSSRQIKLLGSLSLLLLILSHFLFSLSIFFVPSLLWSLIYSVFDIFYYIIWDFQSLMYWVPFSIPFIYYIFLCSHWLRYVAKVKQVSKTRVFYFCFFGSNLIPNSAGFLSTMIAILWMIQALLNIALHKTKPLSPKDVNFLTVLGVHVVCAVARVIYFY